MPVKKKPSAAQLAARAKFVKMVRAKAAAKKKAAPKKIAAKKVAGLDKITKKGKKTTVHYSRVSGVGSVQEYNAPTNSKKMMVKISELAYVYASTGKLKDFLRSNANQYLEVDTKFLFSDQYNLVAGYRIYDTMILAIKNDARENVKEFKNDPDCSFLKWSGIKPEPRPLPMNLPKSIAKIDPQFKNQLNIGTYRLEILNDHYQLANSRQRIRFLFHDGDYYLSTGIGYRFRPNLSGSYPIQYPIPADVKKKVYQILNSI
jgi:hypothetical protein